MVTCRRLFIEKPKPYGPGHQGTVILKNRRMRIIMHLGKMIATGGSDMQNITLAIPDDIILEISSMPSAKKAISEKLQMRLAIGMFVSGEISLAKAAQLAEQNISDFMGTLKSLGIPPFTYTDDMLLDDLKFANEM